MRTHNEALVSPPRLSSPGASSSGASSPGASSSRRGTLPGAWVHATLGLSLAGCITVAPAAVNTTPPAESRLVMVVGERADALGWTTGAAEHGVVRVRMHDGRELVVREQGVAAPWLEAGRWVLRRTADGLEPAEIVSGLDAFLEVRPRGGAPAIIPIGEVVGILHEAPSATSAATTEPLRGRIDAMVVLGERAEVRAGRALSCTDGVVHVLLGDGTEIDVPQERVRDLRLTVGQQVTAFWEGTPYGARVVAVRGAQVRLAWDSDSTSPQVWVQASMLDRVPAPSGAATQLTACRDSGPVAIEVGQRLRVGQLLACEGAVRVVRSGDGIERLPEAQASTRAQLGIGDRIEALWNQSSVYPAQVLSIGERIRVRWEDNSETDVDPADIVSHLRSEPRAVEAVACPAAPVSDAR